MRLAAWFALTALLLGGLAFSRPLPPATPLLAQAATSAPLVEPTPTIPRGVLATATARVVATTRALATPTATPAPLPTAPPRSSATQQAADQREQRASVPPPPPITHRFTPQEDDIVRVVERGVVHIQRFTDDPLIINVLLFDLTAPEFDLRTGLGDGWLSGRTRTSYVALQQGALAGINGDLFAGQGVPQGLTVVDGGIARPPKHRATFWWTDAHEPHIGYVTRSWTWDAHLVATNNRRVWIDETNLPCQVGWVCLYNEFARFVPAVWGDIKLLVAPSGRVVDIVYGEALFVSEGMRVVQGIGDGAEWLERNVALDDTLRFDIRTDPPLDDVQQAISGGPIILRDGQFVQDCLCKLNDCSQVFEFTSTANARAARTGTLLCEDFDTAWKESHYEWVYMPRTGVGFDEHKHTLVVIVVDGYQLGFSRGALQLELADLFLEFGATEAMELDGGGSSTMFLDSEIVNFPSDATGERYVANSLLFFWRPYQADPRFPPSIRTPHQHGGPPLRAR